ncbi:hypothetical protein [uncultured Mucilaginibacter sp.]|uniref:hypothetical protein n=1 Tax=uncultured Mucilaginibacter sp. TaxID=797541 RepID=UPI0025F8F958|nr:hypothetical protein [uncultured Mucilaginibacter sp.]
MNRPPDPAEIRAKAEKLNQFGWLLTIDTLAGFDITKWDLVLNQSYERTIIKLLMNRERMDYQKRYVETANTR